jgi:hypothetical protein
MLNLFSRSFLLFLFCFIHFVTLYAMPRGKVFVGLQLGEQRIHVVEGESAVGYLFIPSGREDLAERISVGYQIWRYFGFESGFTSFSGYDYNYLPNNDSIHRNLYSWDLVGTFTVPFRFFTVTLNGGAVVVYSGANHFYVQFPVSQYTSQPYYYPAVWPHRYFLRPIIGTGFGFDVSKRFRMGFLYSFIRGKGSFSSRIVMIKPKNSHVAIPYLVLNRNYLPTIQFISVYITIKI